MDNSRYITFFVATLSFLYRLNDSGNLMQVVALRQLFTKRLHTASDSHVVVADVFSFSSSSFPSTSSLPWILLVPFLAFILLIATDTYSERRQKSWQVSLTIYEFFV